MALADRSDLQSPANKQLLLGLDDRLSCAVCLIRFEDPRMLDCNHSFCRKCLEDVLRKGVWDPQNPIGDNYIACPKCRAVTELPPGGVTQLRPNYDLKDIIEVLVGDYGLPSLGGSGVESDPSTPFTPLTPVSTQVLPGPVVCEEHQGAPDFFCKDCNQILCRSCVVKDVHRGHTIAETHSVLEEEHQVLQAHYDLVEAEILKTTVGLTDVSDMNTALKEKGEAIKTEIHTRFLEIQKALSSREQLLISTTDTIVQKKVSALKRQSRELHTLCSELKVKKEKVLQIIQHKEDVSYLSEKDTILADICRLVEKSKAYKREPVESTVDGPEYFLPDTILQNAKDFGEVFCAPQPHKFTARGEGLTKAFLEQEAVFVVEARDRYGNRSHMGGTTIDVTIQGMDRLIDTDYTVTEHEQGKFVVHYTPKQLGHHLVVIKADDKPILQSQFTVVVFGSRDYFTLSSSLPLTRITKQQINTAVAVQTHRGKSQVGSEISTMRGVCVLPDGRILFTDQLCLRVVTAKGDLVRTIGSFGVGNGEFKSPMGVTVNRQGHIFVSDNISHRIQKFSNEGRFQAKFGEQGFRNGQFQGPAGLATLADDKLYVADSGNNRIQVLRQRNGQYLSSFGHKGSAPGQFNEPHDIAIDQVRSHVLVSDTNNHRIQILSLEGKPLIEFNSRDSIRPYYITVDRDGFILTTDTERRCVSVFTPHGFPVGHLGSHGSGPGEFQSPHGICTNAEGQVVVTDSSLFCLQVF